MDSVSITITIFAGVCSGIVGIFLQKYWANKKPIISSTSVSFEGTLIQIPQAISEQTKNSSWGQPLEGFVDFKSLLEFEREQGVVAERMRQAKSLVEQWIKDNQDELEGDTLTRSALLACPFFDDTILAASFHGNLRRRKPLNFPINTLEELDAKRIFEIEFDNEKGIKLHLGRKGILFKISEEFGEEQKFANRILAHSFITGSAKNVRWIMDRFIDESSRAIVEIENVRKSVQGLLRQYATFKFGVSITNTGSEPQLVKPYGAVAVGYGDSQRVFLVQHKVMESETNDNLLHLTQTKLDKPKKNQSTNVPYFLDRSDQSPHILVPGNTSLLATFISIEDEVADTVEIIDFYQLGAVSTKVMLETTAGEALVSPSTSFSKSLNSDRRETLKATANKALQRTSR